MLRNIWKQTLLGVAISAGLLAQAPAMAQKAPAAVNPKAAEGFIRQLSDKAFAVLKDKSLSQVDREARFRELLRQGFALDRIGNAVLGKNRRTATPAQITAFNSAFPDYVIRIYANRLTDFSDTKLAVLGSVPAGMRGDVSIRTSVSGKNLQQPVKADWRVSTGTDGSMKIIDLSFEGISMVTTQRDEFDAKIAQKGMDSLIADLRSNRPTTAVKVNAR